MKVLAISGSLRASSSNSLLVEALPALSPAGTEIVVYRDLGALPHFNPDLHDEELPEQVLQLRQSVGSTDALIICSPEYAHGVAGVIKNALDWLVPSLEFPGKAVALINTSPRAHHAIDHMRETLQTMQAQIVEDASITISLHGRQQVSDIINDPDLARALRAALVALAAPEASSAARASVKPVTALTVGIIDVFADAPLQGNPLAVVEGADALNEEQMRRIASEFNQAETTFILSSDCADRKLRSFTAAGAEVFGAGHNALGAWLWLGERGDLGDLTEPKIFRQEIGDDVLPIELQVLHNRVHGRMQQAPLRLFEPLADLQPLAKALGLEEGDLLAEPPARPANTGATHLMVRARSHEDVDKARPNAEALLEVLKGTPAEGCYLYAFDVRTPDKAYARFFNPTVGLWEDAATGTAAGPLSGYLAAEGLAGEALSIEQGTTMGRRSILELRPKPNPILSGAGVVVLIGTMSI